MITEIDTGQDLVVQRFQALAEETRLAILQLLTEGERCVCELQAELDAAQSRLSFHLRKLKDAGLIADRRDGRWVHYRLVPEALDQLRDVLRQLRPEADGRGTTPWVSCCPTTTHGPS